MLFNSFINSSTLVRFEHNVWAKSCPRKRCFIWRPRFPTLIPFPKRLEITHKFYFWSKKFSRENKILMAFQRWFTIASGKEAPPITFED